MESPELRCLGGAADAGDLCVSPAGQPDGDGSRARPLDLPTALAESGPAGPGATVYLAAGVYEGEISGNERVPFEVAAAGTPAAPITIRPAPGEDVHINGALHVSGSHVRLVGLEIGDLEWLIFHETGEEPHKVGFAIDIDAAAGTEIVNCNIFGAYGGVRAGAAAADLVVRGCFIHDFGNRTREARGNALEVISEDIRLVFADNIAGYGLERHVYLEKTAASEAREDAPFPAIGVRDNILYLAGGYSSPRQNMANCLIMGRAPLEGVRLTGNIAYQPEDSMHFKGNLRLGQYRRGFDNGRAEVRDNTLMGAWLGVSLGRWSDLEFSGNRVWSTGVLLEISSAPAGSAIGEAAAKPELAGYRLDSNTYHANDLQKPFRYSANERAGEEDQLTLAQWQALGLDRNSKLVAGKGGRPQGVSATVFANADEKGRGRIGVFNWDRAEAAQVDLSAVLAPGQEYAVFNCLDVTETFARAAAPVAGGSFDGKLVTLPLRRDSASPDFDAFVVLPRAKSTFAARKQPVRERRVPSNKWLHPACEPLPVEVNWRLGGLLALDDGRWLTTAGGASFSGDCGKTWSTPEPLYTGPGPGRPGKSGGMLVQTLGGTIVCLYIDEENSKWDWDYSRRKASADASRPVWSIRSLDGGKTWQDRSCLSTEYAIIMNLIWTRSGHLVLATTELVRQPDHHEVVTYVSADEGMTWQRGTVFNFGGDGNHDGSLEPYVVERRDGRLWMLFRTTHDYFWESFSDDHGLTWDKPQPTIIDASSSPGCLTRLASGRLVLLWNRLYPSRAETAADEQRFPRTAGPLSKRPASLHREELSVAFSEDDGKTWTEPVIIGRETFGTLSYPSVFEPEPGLLWITTHHGAHWQFSVREDDLRKP